MSNRPAIRGRLEPSERQAVHDKIARVYGFPVSKKMHLGDLAHIVAERWGKTLSRTAEIGTVYQFLREFVAEGRPVVQPRALAVVKPLQLSPAMRDAMERAHSYHQPVGLTDAMRGPQGA